MSLSNPFVYLYMYVSLCVSLSRMDTSSLPVNSKGVICLLSTRHSWPFILTMQVRRLSTPRVLWRFYGREFSQVLLLSVWQKVSFQQLTTLLKVCCDHDSNTGPTASMINCATPVVVAVQHTNSILSFFKAKLILPCSIREINPRMWFKIFPLIIVPA